MPQNGIPFTSRTRTETHSGRKHKTVPFASIWIKNQCLCVQIAKVLNGTFVLVVCF